MEITKEVARLRALDAIAEAYDLINDGEFGSAVVNLNVAKVFVDMLQRMNAGAIDMQITEIKFGDGKAPVEITIQDDTVEPWRAT